MRPRLRPSCRKVTTPPNRLLSSVNKGPHYRRRMRSHCYERFPACRREPEYAMHTHIGKQGPPPDRLFSPPASLLSVPSVPLQPPPTPQRDFPGMFPPVRCDDLGSVTLISIGN